jgi:predicted nuclease with TOPRIM domain
MSALDNLIYSIQNSKIINIDNQNCYTPLILCDAQIAAGYELIQLRKDYSGVEASYLGVCERNEQLHAELAELKETTAKQEMENRGNQTILRLQTEKLTRLSKENSQLTDALYKESKRLDSATKLIIFADEVMGCTAMQDFAVWLRDETK